MTADTVAAYLYNVERQVSGTRAQQGLHSGAPHIIGSATGRNRLPTLRPVREAAETDERSWAGLSLASGNSNILPMKRIP